MNLFQKMIASAFFNGYSLSFNYIKDDGSKKRRVLRTITDITYNNDNDILVCGCIDSDDMGNHYRKFFLDNMSDPQVFKKIDPADLDF